MIRIFALNVCEKILNNIKAFEIHMYFDNFSIPTAIIAINDNFSEMIAYPNYDRINTCISKLRRRGQSS
jgi:hypothetical protein